WMEILVQNNVLDDKFLFGDLFKPLLDFYATKWGGVLSGDWENSICRFTTDYENAAGNGFAFTPGTTQPGAWIGSEVYIVRHPDILNPEPENDLVEKFFITTLSVNANGLTADAGEDCVQRVKFYVSMGGKKLDINGDGTYDVVDLKCDDSYSLTGANAIVINSTTYSFSKVCLHFTDISQLAAAFTEQLEGGNEICKSVTSVGESPDIADCGVYCSATGTESEIGGIDLPSIDLGGGAGAEGTEEKPSYKPTPGKSGSPGLV
ncbi:MAG: hypothetical protein NT001_00790, partial [Candidatus Woesearchaeota archaeon]|nr:hypothetical protein [Candidatus Woesearchaeota archaeon]